MSADIAFPRALVLAAVLSLALADASAGRQSDASAAGAELAEGSLLGLQRFVALQRGGPALLEEEDVPLHAMASLEEASVLGLQRKVELAHRQPALSLVQEEEDLELGDVSVLGLQRSATLVRRQPPPAAADASA
mmetsp:Transcript_61233/g.132702  ORF Transcript_61233/g.132702 Transcript_61233/m.132702 type:complete len:135 (-) Transcript_61233:111-515(-)